MDIKIYGLILLVFLLSSCTSVTRYNEIRKYKLGSAASELTSVIDIEDLENVTVGGKEFTYYKSNIITSVIEKKSKIGTGSSIGAGSSSLYNSAGATKTTTTASYAGIYFIYQNNKLYAYGHLYELKQHSDPLVIEVANKIDDEEGEI